jgi:hypothetical protein
VGSCTESPTEVQSSQTVDLHDLYLKKLQAKPIDQTFEEFKALYAKKQSMKKTVTTVSADPPDDWDPVYGENIYLHWDSSIDITDPARVNNPIPANFNFKFYGLEYNQIYVNSNGNITFGREFPYADIELPAASETPIIAPLAGDFDPEDDSEDNVYFKLTGDMPNRILVITWVNVQEYDPNGPNTFQLKLFEGSNNIQFGYNGLTTSGFDNGFGTYYPQEVGISSASDQVLFAAVGDEIPDLDGTNICISPTGPEAVEYNVYYGVCGSAEAPGIVPVDRILNARLALEELLAGPEIEKKLKKATEKAIDKLDKSLDPKNWIDDTTPDPKHGKKVFDELKKAVKELMKFRKAKGASLEQKLYVEEVIFSLLDLCKGFAEEAIAELDLLYCDTGKCGKEKGKALSELTKAEEEIAKDHWDHALDKYKKAWEHALKALKHYNNETP